MDSKIIKNSSYLLGAQIAVKATSFLYTIFLLRNLNVENFGLLTAATAYFSLFSTISDFGINRYLIREIAQDKNKTFGLLSQALILRILTLTTIFLLFSIVTLIFDPIKLRAILSILAIMAIFPQIISLTFDSILVAFERFDISAKGILILNFSNVIIGFLLISLGFEVFGAIIALILSQLIYAVVLFLMSRQIGLKNFNLAKLTMVKYLITESLPYGFLAILGLLYFRVDTLLLTYLKGPYETGIYGAAYKFLEALIFIPSAISATLFPVFARLSEQNQQTIYALYKKSLLVNLSLALLIMVGYLTILPVIIRLFLPRFSTSIEIIGVLALTIPFLFMISPQSLVLLSQRKFLSSLIKISVFNLLLNVILNLIFIPRFSYFAAAWITVFSDLVGFLIFFGFIKFKFSPK